ncbi:MAG: purine-nucleoside phosphorylase [Synergistaceae bacterium]|jgi:purine-nucleoside phosphorylase|nr:purine-nucleoside phosphorylase [Synergistaceae bacterium]
MSYDESYYEKVTEALDYIQSAGGDFHPETAIVLGSGLGQIADEVSEPKVIETRDIPHWPRSTSPGHAGQVILGKIEGRPVVVLKGRVHYYEGYDMRQVTFSTRVLGMWKVRQYIGTNASGGIDFYLKPGDVVLIHDHINYMGINPLVGPTEPRWGVRFPDMTNIYSPRLIGLCEQAASIAGIQVHRGVYIAFSGPSYETPAEIRMARTMGASVVGMSTVPETIVANAMGMETAVISCVGNPAAGMNSEELTEEEVLLAMKAASGRIGMLICGLMRALEDEGLRVGVQ